MSTECLPARLLSQAPLALPAAGFALGTLTGGPLDGSAWSWLLAGLGCSLLAWRCRGGWRRVSLAAAALMAGLGWHGLRGPRDGPVAGLAQREPGPVRVEGRLRHDPQAWPGRARFDLEVESLERRGGERRLSGRLRVTLYGLPEHGVPRVPHGAGDRVRVTGWLRAPRNAGNPGATDRVASLRRDGVDALLVVKGPQLIIRLQQAGLARRLLALPRRFLGRELDRRLGGPLGLDPDHPSGLPAFPHTREAAVARALVLGDRGRIRPDALAELREAGLVHILAVSGLHVGLVALLVFGMCRVLRLEDHRAAWVALVATWSYALLTGLAPPACRAAVMASIVLLGRALYLEGTALNSLSLALVAGLLLEPEGLRSAGFQLTFAATASLLLLSRRIWERLPQRPGPLWKLLAVSLAAQTGVLPLAAYHFHRVTPLAAIGSLVAVPAAALILVAGTATALVSPLCDMLAAVLAWVTRLAVAVVFATASTRGLDWSWRVSAPPAWLLLAYVVVLLLASSTWAGSRRGLRPAAWGLFALCVLAILVPPWPSRFEAERGLALHLIDVGQGDAMLLEGPQGGRLLMDGGGSPFSDFDVGEQVLAPALLARRIRRLDVVVLSHAHPDHAEGVLTALESFRVAELWVGIDPPGDPLFGDILERAAARGIPVRLLKRGQQLRWDGVEVSVLNPPAVGEPLSGVSNNASVVLRLAWGRRAFLLTGDIHQQTELELARGPYRLRADVLKVAHHGSRTSSTPVFLKRVSPRVALVSCGVDNRYGLPDPSVLERLEAAGARVYRTDRDGMLSVWTDGEKLWFRKFTY